MSHEEEILFAADETGADNVLAVVVLVGLLGGGAGREVDGKLTHKP